MNLDAKVQRLHIGTHKPRIETELRELLSSHGWRCHADYSMGTSEETQWGKIKFQDGVQGWMNPGSTRFRRLRLKLRSMLLPMQG
jgi:hypothetical protein